MFGIYLSLNISGGHLNPAVSLAMVVFKKFPLKDMLLYWVAQVAGAYVGSLIVYLDYYQELKHHGHLHDMVGASIFASFRDSDSSDWNGFYD